MMDDEIMGSCVICYIGVFCRSAMMHRCEESFFVDEIYVFLKTLATSHASLAQISIALNCKVISSQVSYQPYTLNTYDIQKGCACVDV